MLRKRSRALTSKQAKVRDHSNHPWLPPENPTKPRTFFKGFFFTYYKTHTMMTRTSILDTNPFSTVANFWVFNNTHQLSSNKNSQHQHPWEQPSNKQGIGLALIDENFETDNNNSTIKQQKRKFIVFGSQLNIQVPCLDNSSVFPCFSSESPREFGIKTPRSNLWEESFMGFGNDSLSMNDIDEQSEDYTCVISHGPNPKTTHIFGNCVVESCCGKIVGSTSFSSKTNENYSSMGSHQSSLSFCHHCEKKLGEGMDIYMYRGEKGFCSEECRCQGMAFDGVEN